MKDEIGVVAGMVWELMRERGELSTQHLARATKARTNVVHMAVGWLARENKVEVRTEGDKVYVALV